MTLTKEDYAKLEQARLLIADVQIKLLNEHVDREDWHPLYLIRADLHTYMHPRA